MIGTFSEGSLMENCTLEKLYQESELQGFIISINVHLTLHG